MSTQAPETRAQKRPPRSPGTPGDTTAARRPPSPPLYRAGTDANPGDGRLNWLADKIETSRRAARPKPCPKCSQDVLVGPSADFMYWTATVDPTPVDAITEVAALLNGAQSYDLIRGRLHHRADHHTHTPQRPHPVLLDHACPGRPTGALF